MKLLKRLFSLEKFHPEPYDACVYCHSTNFTRFVGEEGIYGECTMCGLMWNIC